MIPDFKTFISESIWSDIQDRSSGDTVREEDMITTNEDLRAKIQELYKEQGEGDTLDVSSLTKLIKCDDFSYIFKGYKKVKHIIGLEDWDVSKVTNMKGMFYNCENFNSDLSNWDVSSVGNMHSMFYRCKTFNSDLSKWNVRKVKNIGDVFYNCKSLKQIPSWYMKYNRKINESIWSDIQDRSMGKTVRKEDDINLLDIDELCEYLKTIYKVDSDSDINVIEIEGNMYLTICLYEDEYGYYRYIYYDGDYINTQLDVIETLKCLLEFERKFSIKFNENDFVVNCIDIYPKDKARIPVTNKFFIEVLDFILDRINTPLEQKIKKISNIKESIWSDIQDRSSGDTVRKEDDIDNLNYEEFFTYLTEHYQPKSKKGNEKISGRTPIMDTDIFEIFIPIEYIDSYLKGLMVKISKKDNCVVSMITSQTLFDKYVNLERMLSNNYALNASDYSYRMYIKPKKKPTNKTAVDLIDIFLDVVDNPILEKIS